MNNVIKVTEIVLKKWWNSIKLELELNWFKMWILVMNLNLFWFELGNRWYIIEVWWSTCLIEKQSRSDNER